MQKQVQVCEYCGASLDVLKTRASRTIPGGVTSKSVLGFIICPSCKKETSIFKQYLVPPQVE